MARTKKLTFKAKVLSKHETADTDGKHRSMMTLQLDGFQQEYVDGGGVGSCGAPGRAEIRVQSSSVFDFLVGTDVVLTLEGVGPFYEIIGEKRAPVMKGGTVEYDSTSLPLKKRKR